MVALDVLFPAGVASADAVLRGIRPLSPPADRPYVVANFIATVDGSVSMGGESGTIGRFAPGDREVFNALREQVDAVVAGTGTIAHEQYGRLIADPEMRARRMAAGLPGDALAVVLSRSGNVPSGVPMLDDPEQPRRVFTHEAADPVAALRALRHEDGVELLLCEGGPTLLGDLVRRGLVDELFLTFSPVLCCGEAETSLLGGAADHPRPLELRALVKAGGGLHARYAMLATGNHHAPERLPGAHQPQ